MQNHERLFVYGSLQPGHENAHLLEAIGGTWQRATVVGVLRPAGWGAGIGYPALTLDPDGSEVHGVVFSSNALANHWQRLDEFEGEDYERVATPVRLDDGSVVDAYVYVLNIQKSPRR